MQKQTQPARKPKFGQNFLVDDAARHRIVDALGDISNRTVIEIGPGHGAITSILAGRAKRLVAIELDHALATELRFRLRNHANVEIIEADILNTDLRPLLPEAEQADVIGNLPYYITSDILLHLFKQADVLDRAVLMMQREVAERVSAAPGVRDYGLLSATTQMYGSVDQLFTLPPSAFDPPPDVYSTVIRIVFSPRFHELGVDPAGFDRFLRQCFQQKRKTLNNNLRSSGYSSAQIDEASAGILSPQARAESLSLQQMSTLYRALLATAPLTSD